MGQPVRSLGVPWESTRSPALRGDIALGPGDQFDAIEYVYEHQPLTEKLICAVVPSATPAVALATARAVGYSVAE